MTDRQALLDSAWNLFRAGRFVEAENLLLGATHSFAQDADACFLLGAARHAQERLPQALEAFQQAVHLAPSHLQAQQACALLLTQLGRPLEALAVLQGLLREQPRDAQILTNTAILLEDLRQTDQALLHYERALEAQPDFLDALQNRGALLVRQGRLDEALANNRQLARRHAGLATAHYNLAETLLAMAHYSAAIEACDAALRIEPAHAAALLDKGLALAAEGRLAEAEACLQAVRRDDPLVARKLADAASNQVPIELDARAIYLVKGFERLEACDWSQRDTYLERFTSFIREPGAAPLTDRALPFRALAVGLAPELQFELSRNVARHVVENARALCPAGFAHARRSGGRIRIGYLSPDFRHHALGYLSRRLFSLHDRDRYEIHGYALCADDGSAIRRDIERGCELFLDLSGFDALAAARRIHADGIDILVDMMGYATAPRSEILALRPAPLQVSYLNYVGTMGADFMDYQIADAVLLPPAVARWHAERIAFLPGSFYLYDDAQEAGAAAPAAQALQRREWGLPEQGVVFCCFNNAYKIEPEIFSLWVRLLDQVPGSVLWLLYSGAAACANLRQAAADRGIAAERLVFARRVEPSLHLARSRLADLFLDTPRCNAGTTALDALWAGVPVLTCPGNSMASRLAASAVTAVGLAEMVAPDLAAYENRARDLAADPEKLAALRQRLAILRKTAPLFDTRRYVRDLERAYAAMWRRHEQGLPPQSFAVPVA